MSAKVSIIMAAFNCEDVVAESIDSMINQSFTDWEFIICDDGSTDGTHDVLKKYKELYPDKFIILQNETNKFLPYSLNHCLKYATGEYVARMDADDKSSYDRLEKQYAFLTEHPEYDVVGTGMKCFDGDKFTGDRFPMKSPDRSIIGKSVPFFHATIMMKKSVYVKLGGYSLKKNVIRCEDVDLWMRFFANGFKGANLQECLYYVREDLNAVKRRTLKHAVNCSVTLLRGYRKYKYPVKQYIYAVKPVIAALVPTKIKYFINQRRWK